MKTLIAFIFAMGIFGFAQSSEARRFNLNLGEGVKVGKTFVACGGETTGFGECNQHGCSSCGTCNSYGCPDCDSGYSGGTCNVFGCWDGYQGSCNSYGCLDNGECNEHGCSENGTCNSYGCP